MWIQTGILENTNVPLPGLAETAEVHYYQSIVGVTPRHGLEPRFTEAMCNV
jgi:hypothetical protein